MSSKRPHRIARALGLLGLLLLLLTLCAGPLTGQGAGGTVVEADTARSIEGAFVTVVDEGGRLAERGYPPVYTIR
jgi:hypothetical protein